MSIVTFLTIGQNPYKIFFIYFKQVDDIYDKGEKFWYEKRGQKGEAKWVWEAQGIKQWTFGANDTIADTWISELLTKKKIEEKFKNSEERFELLYKNYFEKRKTFDFKDVPSLINEIPSVFLSDEKYQELSILIDEPDNVDFIEGYKSNVNISPILPYKFFEEGFLKKQIQSRVLLYRLNRQIRFEFKGDRNNVDEDNNTKRLFGKCFESKSFRLKYIVDILDINENPNGTSKIDENTGDWEINLLKPASSGFILLKCLANNKYEYATRFFLLKEFKIDVVSNETIVDSFQNKYFIPASPKSFSLIPPYSWEEEYFVDRTESLKKLSNTLELMLCSLGKNIVLNDPYLFGITNLENNIPQYNESQIIFLNALSLAIVKAGVETVTIIGRWDKARKSFINGTTIDSKETLYSIYEIALKAIKKQLNRLPSLKLKSLSIIFPNETFHDRFWAELNDSGNVINIYHISSSVSAYTENGELIILPLEGSLLNKVRTKIEARLNSQNIKEIVI